MPKLSKLSTIRLQASTLAIAAAIGLSACGGGGGSSSNDSVGVTPPPPPPAAQGTSFTIDGSSTKGLILNGYVDVVDAADASNLLIEGRTDAADGTYDVTIPASANFTGPFVRVTVRGGPNAEMICDAPDGCLNPEVNDSFGDPVTVEFGLDFPIDETVSLSAIVPTPADNTTDTVNLTIFSDLAASLADDNADGTLTAEDISDANAQVSDLFGLLTIDPTELESVNIADSTANSTDDASIRAAILSGGVLGAAFESGVDVGAALEKLRTDFLDNDGQLVINEAVDDPNLISLEDILEESLSVTEESEIEGEDFQAAAAEILGDSVSAAGADEGEPTSAGTAPSNNAPALEQAQAFVEDLQLVVEAVQSQETEDNFVEFAERVEDAARLIEDDAEDALDAALMASEAIALAYEAYQDDNNITTHSANGFTVDVSSSNGDLSLVIAEQTVGGETVQMSIIGDLDVTFEQVNDSETSDILDENTGLFESQSSEEESTIVTIGNDASFTGSVENSAVLVEILGGEVSVRGGEYETTSIFSSQSASGQFIFQNSSSFESTEFVLLAAERVSGSLDVNISEKRDDGLAFEGVASASLIGGRFESNAIESSEGIGSSNTGFFYDTDSVQIESTDVSFSGSFSEGGQFVDLSFAFQADGEELVLTNGGELTDVSTYAVADLSLIHI